MSLDVIKRAAQDLVGQLAREDYESVIARCAKSRLSSQDLCSVIQDYGRKVVLPPPDADKDVDAVRIEGTMPQTWSVRIPLWTHEEGRSDLTLELTIVEERGGTKIELDDLRVL